jgi:hypothetical protein
MQATVFLLSTLALVQGPSEAEEERGLVVHEAGAFDGYTLFCPLKDTTTYLVDMEGRVVHTWASDLTPGNSVYLMDDGHLFRCARLDNETFNGGGQGGRVRELDWDGTVLWDWSMSDGDNLAHHDIEPLPNGNLLVIAWELRTAEQAAAVGRDPGYTSDEGFWPDVIFEIKPVRPDGAEVVWEWHAFDHLVQDFDAELTDYGSPADHPERIDVNGDHRRDRPMTAEERERQEEVEREMRALGYLGGDEEEEDEEPAGDERRRTAGDWLHTNGIDYRADLDLIVVSVRTFSEMWVIDHSTTTEQARGRTGGRWKRGGDLVYRWGNPMKHGAGDESDRRLFVQHDAQWVPPDCPGAGNLLVFNNGEGRPDGPFSSVDEIAPPLDPEHGFGAGPSEPTWSYVAPEKASFFSSFISGAQRLSNGNTLICEGASGRVFEVTPEGATVWEYLNPFGEDRPPEDRPPEGGPQRGPPDGGDGRPPGGREGPPGGRDGQPGGQGGPPGGGRRGGGRKIPKGLFRATRIAPNHPGLDGRDLTPRDE